MKNIIKALGGFGAASIIFATSYFLILYQDFTQLILALGIAGIIILAALIYVYNWMKNTDDNMDENKEVTDRLNMYIREVEKKIK